MRSDSAALLLIGVTAEAGQCVRPCACVNNHQLLICASQSTRLSDNFVICGLPYDASAGGERKCMSRRCRKTSTDLPLWLFQV